MRYFTTLLVALSSFFLTTQAQEPAFTLRVSPDKLLPLMKGAPAETKSPVFILKGAGVKEIRAAVFPHGEGAAPMVGFIGNPEEIKELLGEEGPLADLLQTKGGGVYEFPLDAEVSLKFKITERPDGMWLSLLDTPMALADLVQKQVSQLPSGKEYAGELSFITPKSKKMPWVDATLKNMGVTGFPAMGMSMMFSGMIEPLDHLEGAERVSLGALAAGGDARLLDVELEMDDAARVTNLASYINDGKPGPGRYKEMTKFLAHPELRARAVPKDEDLVARFVWKQSSEETLMPLLQRAMQKMMREPLQASTGEVFTQTNDQLPITVPYDKAAKKAELEKALTLENMFLSASSSETRGSVRLYPDLGDNAILTGAVMVDYKSVVNAAGEDLREINKEYPARGRIEHNRETSMSLRFNKEKKGPATKMVAEISMDLPGSVHLAEFKASDAPGTTRMAGDVPVTLERIENDVVSVWADTTKEDFFLYVQVFDAEGRMLNNNMGGWGPKGRTSSFFGKIETVKAFAVADKEKLVLPLNLSFPPPDQQRPPTKRPAYELLPYYPLDHVTAADLEKTTTSYINRGAYTVLLNCPGKIAKSDWTFHAFGESAAAKLGHTYPKETDYKAFSDRDAEPDAVRVIFGSVDFSAYVDLVEVDLSAANPETDLPGGDKVTAEFGESSVALNFSNNDWKNLNFAVYDENGRRLKADRNLRSVRGQAKSIKFQASKTLEKKSVAFEYPLGEFDAAALEAYKAGL